MPPTFTCSHVGRMNRYRVIFGVRSCISVIILIDTSWLGTHVALVPKMEWSVSGEHDPMLGCMLEKYTAKSQSSSLKTLPWSWPGLHSVEVNSIQQAATISPHPHIPVIESATDHRPTFSYQRSEKGDDTKIENQLSSDRIGLYSALVITLFTIWRM